MMYSAYKLNKQGDIIQPWCIPFPIWNQSVVPCPVLTVASWPEYRFPNVRLKIRAFVPRRKNRATQYTTPADATRKRVDCRLRKRVTLISWEAEHPNSKLGKLFICKKTILSAYYIRVTKWLVTRLQSNPIGTNFAGYMFTKQSYWHKLHGLWFKLKAILLVQTARAFVQT